MLKLLIVLFTFVALALAKECTPGQNCELRCCTVSKGDALCRARCLGLSCELDGDCDGDCCVNSTCTSCLFKRLFTTPTTILENTEESDLAVEVVPTDEDDFEERETTSPIKNVETNVRRCSRFNNNCASKCCIDGECVDSSQCTPKVAARRGGGRTVYRGGGGGGGSSGGSDWPVWAWGVLAGGIFLFAIIPCLIKWFCK